MAAKTKYVEGLEPRLLLAGTLVKDLDTTSLSSSPSALLMFGAKGYFAANDGVHGVELWSTDGTADGTQLVKDIRPGSADSNFLFLGEFKGYLYLWADNGTGKALWRTDGTEAGTTLFKNVAPSSGLVLYKNAAYFTVSSALWKTDGTAAGTVLVDGSGFHSYLTRVGDYLFYSNSSSNAGFELWRSDGTAAGSMMVKDINPGTSDGLPEQFHELNGLLYFRANSPSGIELWKSDGTPEGTVMVRDINPGAADSFPDNLTTVGGLILFRAATQGQNLWRTDGTDAGTFELTRFAVSNDNGGNGARFKTAGGLAFFLASDGGQYGLWRSDGSVAGTFMIHSVPTGYVINQFAGIGDALYFRISHDGVQEFWKTDGTDAGTSMITSAVSQVGYALGAIGQTTLASLADFRGMELWQTDGTDAGTTLLKDINFATVGSNPQLITNVNGTLFFTGAQQLWKSDGTEAGTVPVAPLPSKTYDDADGIGLNGLFIFSNGNYPIHNLWRSDGTPEGTYILKSNGFDVSGELFAFGGYVYFTGVSGTAYGLYRTDGTVPGTTLVKNGLYPENFVQFKDAIYFINGGGSLWKTDGTADGTVEVNHTVYDTRPVVFGDKLYYSGCDAANGCELWSTDGNGAGGLFAGFNAGSGSANPRSFAISNGLLYFTANSSSSTQGLYRTSGSTSGTGLVQQYTIGAGVGGPVNLTDVNGSLFFSVGGQLWKTNGNLPGVFNLGNVGSASSLYRFKSAGGLLIFLNPSDGLWISDGTVAGTQRFMDHELAFAGVPSIFVVSLNDSIYFRANRPDVGAELFKLSPPIPRTSGPYTVGIYSSTPLDATASLDADPTNTLSFMWDLDGDNIFGETGAAAARGDEIGPTPTFSAANIISAAKYNISLLVRSSSGVSSQITTTVNVRGAQLFGTNGNDIFRIVPNGATFMYDFYENAPPGAGPTFSIPTVHVSSFSIDGGAGDDVLTINTGSPFTFSAGSGNDSLFFTGGFTTFSSDAASLGIENISLSRTASLIITASQHISSLSLTDSSGVIVNSTNRVLRLGAVSMGPDTNLNLNDNALILGSGDLTTITADIRTGLNSTHGIRGASNNRRLGAIVNSNSDGSPLYTTFAGEANLSGQEILVRYTLVGDLNLDRQVSIADFIALAAHFNQSPATWADGDTNYDNAVTIADFIDLAANFGQVFSGSATPQAASSFAISTTSTNSTTKRRQPRMHHHSRRTNQAHIRSLLPTQRA